MDSAYLKVARDHQRSINTLACYHELASVFKQTHPGVTLIAPGTEVKVGGSVKVDLKITSEIGGAATSTVDATYKIYVVRGLDNVIAELGQNLILTSIDSFETIPQLGQSEVWNVYGCCFSSVVVDRNESFRTLYLTLLGIYPDLPPLGQLTEQQKQLITSNVEMLTDYIRK